MNSQANANTRARGSWLTVTQIAWIVFALTLTVIQVAGQIAAFRELRNINLTPLQNQGLQAMGLSAEFYAVLRFFWQLPNPLVWGGLGLLIFLRKSNDRGALILSAMMVGTGMATSIPTWKAFAVGYPEWIGLVAPVAFIGNICLHSFFFVFPTGRYVPRWTVGLAIILSAFNILNSYDFALSPALITLGKSLDWVFPIFSIVVLVSFIGVPIYRYRWVSTPVEKEQIKWVVFTIVAALVIFAATASTVFLAPGGNPDTDISFITVIVQPIGWVSTLLLIPLSIAVAILRYRLFDIDIIIRRTLIYGVLTALLVLFYFGSVILLQQLLSGIAGQSSEIAIIASRLTIAALFNSLRRRVHDVIDHRFYRRKYDAQKVLAAFGATARDEVDLSKLTNELVGVVQETMQPASVSVWLRNTNEERALMGRGEKFTK